MNLPAEMALLEPAAHRAAVARTLVASNLRRYRVGPTSPVVVDGVLPGAPSDDPVRDQSRHLGRRRSTLPRYAVAALVVLMLLIAFAEVPVSVGVVGLAGIVVTLVLGIRADVRESRNSRLTCRRDVEQRVTVPASVADAYAHLTSAAETLTDDATQPPETVETARLAA